MSTAIIISGVLRNIVNASSSWLIDADYYLITDNKIYNPQSTNTKQETATNIISDIVNKTSVTFSSINILLDETLKLSTSRLKAHPEFAYHPIINMAFKWKCAFHMLSSVQDIKQYNKILLWRPDIYIRYNTPIKNFNKQLPIPNHVHNISGIDTNNETGYSVTDDNCLMFNYDVFRILAGFFDYFIQFHDDTILNKHDVHSLLARYFIERGVTIDNLLSNYIDYIILRSNTDHMFNNGMLMSNYSIEDLRTKQYDWWKENINNDQ